MDPVELAEEIRSRGLAAGLDRVGICGAQPFVRAREAIEQRKADGLAAGMQFTYRRPHRSTTPTTSLVGAACLVVGARRYERTLHQQSGEADGYQPRGAADGGAVAARVARYSWEDHYQPLREALRTVAEVLRAEGWQAQVVVDDNALVDRAAAERAGLGWYGKNTNILLPHAGSWFVLGSVITDAQLPVDAPVPDGCGPCRRCISACPTGALSPGVLDGRRCLAWLVQAPGVFPREFRAALGDRLYGCDDCQEVCPVNLLATRRDPPSRAGPAAEAIVNVLEVLGEADEVLLARWGRWYIPKRQPRYLRRNALIVLGNVAEPFDPAVVAALTRALGDPDPLVRAHAVWAAARLGRVDLLNTPALAADADPMVRAEIMKVDTVPPRDGMRGNGTRTSIADRQQASVSGAPTPIPFLD